MATRRLGRLELSLMEKLAAMHWAAVVLVALIGLVGYGVLYSAAGGAHEPWAWRHGVRLGAGLLIMLAIALIDLRLIFRLAYALFGLTLLLLVAVEAIGDVSKGAQRWLDLGVIQLQPSELMKVALLLAIARYFHSTHVEDRRRPLLLIPPIVMIALPVGLIMLQPDLGTAAVLAASGVVLMFAAGVPWWPFLLTGGLAGGAMPLLWSRMHDYQRQRVLTFLDPERDPLGAGYHIIQSKIALGSGGFWGQGFLGGSQAQLSFLPEKHTDFAFTMLAEETGFVGAVAVLALFFTLGLTALSIAMRASSQFARLVAAGVTINLTLYVGINLAMVTGLIPVVGVPLPLVSYGGTAMLTTLVGAGLMLNVHLSRHLLLPRYPVDS